MRKAGHTVLSNRPRTLYVNIINVHETTLCIIFQTLTQGQTTHMTLAWMLLEKGQAAGINEENTANQERVSFGQWRAKEEQYPPPALPLPCHSAANSPSHPRSRRCSGALLGTSRPGEGHELHVARVEPTLRSSLRGTWGRPWGETGVEAGGPQHQAGRPRTSLVLVFSVLSFCPAAPLGQVPGPGWTQRYHRGSPAQG